VSNVNGIIREEKETSKALGSNKPLEKFQINEDLSEKKNQSKTFSVVSFWVQNHEKDK